MDCCLLRFDAVDHYENDETREVQSFIKNKLMAFLRTATVTCPLFGVPVRLSAAQSCVARYTLEEVHEMLLYKGFVSASTTSNGLWPLLKVC